MHVQLTLLPPPVNVRELRNWQQAIGFFLDHGITLATQLLQFGPVQYFDLTPGVTDDADLLKLSCRLRNAFAPNAEHVGDEPALSLGTPYVSN